MVVSCHLCADLSKEELFATPSFISAKISPDGKTIAYVGADKSGIANIFIKKRAALESAEQISFFTTPPISRFFWTPDSQMVLFLRNEDGTGQLSLHGIETCSKKHVVYTDKFPNVNAKVIHISTQKNQAVIGLNHRNPHFHDLYILDLKSGEFKLLLENNQYAKFLVSDDLAVILKMRINDDSSWTVLTKDDQIFMEISPEEAFQTECLSYNEKEQAVYLLDNRFSDTNQLTMKFLKGGEKILGWQADSDVDDVLFVQGEPKAYASYYTQKEWHVIDLSVNQDILFLTQHVGSDFEVKSQNKEGDIWIVASCLPEEGPQCWLYERKVKELLPLYSPQWSKSAKESLSKMYSMVVTSRDGRNLVCYYTLPKNLDKGGTVDKPIPLVVIPHGGPFQARNKLEFDDYHQWLASCGYAVLSVNFRLSSGFGKTFVNAGNGEWGGKAHLDVKDAVEACIAKGITQHGKLAVFGGSYGGYEALASLVFSPDYYACCVSICGPSNLKTVLDNVPKFWELTTGPLSDKMKFFTKQAFITSMGGDPDKAEGIKFLEKCSPLNHLEAIKAPLLLVHGQNDHIVAEKESRQIYTSMKKNHKTVTCILFPDEGHGLAKFPNSMLFLDHAERFLSQHLGGKYQPVSADVMAKSSGQVLGD